MKGSTEALARFAATTGLEDIPSVAREAAKLNILDTLGVCLAASRTAACQALGQWVRDEEGPPRASVIGQGFRTSAQLAALVNGHEAHALDLDEGFHWGTPTLPAALAVAEPARVSGATLLKALILGREISHRLDAAFDSARTGGRGPTFRGWHHTGTNGSLASAVAAGAVLGLDTRQMQWALGHAANMACGLRANMGTHAKGIAAGNPARNGVVAATLAKRNFTAEEAILEVSEGFAMAFCLEGEATWEPLTKDLGQRYVDEGGPTARIFASCGPSHRPVEAVLNLAREHNLKAEDVEAIECDPHSFAMRRHDPQDSPAAQYCLEYVLCAALLDGAMGAQQVMDERVRAADVQGLMRRLRFIPIEAPPHGTPTERLTLHLKDGRRVSTEIQHAKRINTPAEIEAKYFECATLAISRESAEKLRDTVLRIESLPDITAIMDIARG
ncbi:MAG: MmgE/PrpD family protein [Chloroflexi bacterium]|nr:MmgE/PrpD family protein [Chloroflexota bacterium]